MSSPVCDSDVMFGVQKWRDGYVDGEKNYSEAL